jgi:type IV pilus assembly protein PilC
MQEMLLKIKSDIEGGSSFAEALRGFPMQFDDLFCNLVEAGEHAGILDSLLDKIATYREKTESIKGKIKKALFYPVAVIIVAVLVIAVIMIFVVPQFEAMFAGFGAELPAPTQVIVNMSHFVSQWWWAMLIGFGVVFFVISFLFKRFPKLREGRDRVMLRAPVFGDMLRKSAIARFSRTLATMFAAGVPLVDSLGSVAGATGNVVYQEAVLRMREDVATGQSLTASMRQTNLFPHLVVQMITIGEESGALDTMLSKVADFFEEEVDNAVDALTSLLEPLVMVILGTVVGGIIVALYLPIFQIGEAI